MIEIVKHSRVKLSSPLLTGLTYAFFAMGLLTIVASLLLLATSQQEDELPVYAYVIHVLSLLLGGYAAGKRAGRRGWYYGGVLGVLYALVVWLVAFLGYDRGLDAQSLLFIGIAFLSGALGGMFGVNASGRK
ncbi:TIGR04086 family membrane protein [Paenibacillus cymbidii]|uniref:TIGR04086 family membrane protein n=1 Tax=Paenibacillus cymbidii TaxID=1639034 RepID=UPI0010805DA6|nr:TIGR04086 family membrane protein [Paenibacillus cymbidii]